MVAHNTLLWSVGYIHATTHTNYSMLNVCFCSHMISFSISRSKETLTLQSHKARDIVLSFFLLYVSLPSLLVNFKAYTSYSSCHEHTRIAHKRSWFGHMVYAIQVGILSFFLLCVSVPRLLVKFKAYTSYSSCHEHTRISWFGHMVFAIRVGDKMHDIGSKRMHIVWLYFWNIG